MYLCYSMARLTLRDSLHLCTYGTVALKITQKCLGMLSNIAKVDGLTSFSKE